MNILFLTLLDFDSIEEKGIYTDLLREFVKNRHYVYAISPIERRKAGSTRIIKNDRITILKLKIGNTQKTNIIEKGISTLTIEPIFVLGIKRYFANIKFDLIIYSTPPITFYNAVKFVKKRDNSKTYLLLKDIFPQNAVDIGMMSTSGLKGMIYKFFRQKEKKLYGVSDYIGCMSPANKAYVITNNPEINPSIVGVCPNSIEVVDKSVMEEKRIAIRKKYEIPIEKRVFVYGGNLGKPQGIDFLIKCLYSQKNNRKAFFLIVGDGTEYAKIENFVRKYHLNNVKLMNRLPKEDYDTMVGACDIGMIFLDHRFTIPNFPSRILSYMQAKIPILACTDPNTDIGKTIVEGGFGWWGESNDISNFDRLVKQAIGSDLAEMGKIGYNYLCQNFSSEKSYNIIMNSCK